MSDRLIPVRTDDSTPERPTDRWRVLYWNRWTFQLREFKHPSSAGSIGWFEADYADADSAFATREEAEALLERARRENCIPPYSWEHKPDPFARVYIERWTC